MYFGEMMNYSRPNVGYNMKLINLGVTYIRIVLISFIVIYFDNTNFQLCLLHLLNTIYYAIVFGYLDVFTKRVRTKELINYTVVVSVNYFQLCLTELHNAKFARHFGWFYIVFMGTYLLYFLIPIFLGTVKFIFVQAKKLVLKLY